MHAHVDAERLLAAHPLEGLLLQRAQHLGLGLEAHVADLVEEQRAAVGGLELAAAARHGAGEGAALVAEELGLDQLLGDGGAVDLDEGRLAPRRQGVDGAGHQLLAGAVLAVDEHAPVGGRGDGDLLAQLVASSALSPMISWPRVEAARAARRFSRSRRAVLEGAASP